MSTVPTKTKQLSAIEFGRQLLETKDLDPTYVLIHEAKLPHLQLYLLAYLCYYHLGTAAWIVDQPLFWKAMETAAASKEYPRSSERRHFRGENARKSIAWLKAQGGVGELFDYFNHPATARNVIAYVKTWEGFSKWAAFKLADMVERLGICQIDFTDSYDLFYGSPQKGAKLVWNRAGQKGTQPENLVKWACDYILERLIAKAPPRYERQINVQEAETILCKFHAYVNGHYHVGKDIHECKEALLRFPRSPTAQRLLQAGKAGGLWYQGI